MSINENFDTTPFGRAMIGILSVFAQLERENIYLRTRMGMLGLPHERSIVRAPVRLPVAVLPQKYVN